MTSVMEGRGDGGGQCVFGQNIESKMKYIKKNTVQEIQPNANTVQNLKNKKKMEK